MGQGQTSVISDYTNPASRSSNYSNPFFSGPGTRRGGGARGGGGRTNAPAGPSNSSAAPTPTSSGRGNIPAPAGVGPSGNTGSLPGMLDTYTSPLGSIADSYIRSFGRGGPLDIPSFQELYGSYRDVAEKETARRGAALTEAYGSMGARYGSDILRGQAGLQRDLATDLRNASGNFLTGLRGQQFQENSFFSGLQSGGFENAMQRLFADFLRRTGPPPLVGSATSAGPGYAQPGTYFV